MPEQTLASDDSALRARGYSALAALQIEAVAPVPMRAHGIASRDYPVALALATERGPLPSTFASAPTVRRDEVRARPLPIPELANAPLPEPGSVPNPIESSKD